MSKNAFDPTLEVQNIENGMFQNAPFAYAPFANDCFPNVGYSCLWALTSQSENFNLELFNPEVENFRAEVSKIQKYFIN